MTDGQPLGLDDYPIGHPDTTHREMLDEIDASGEGVTGWEIRFISDYIDKDRTTFTPRQSEILCKIYRQRVLLEDE